MQATSGRAAGDGVMSNTSQSSLREPAGVDTSAAAVRRAAPWTLNLTPERGCASPRCTSTPCSVMCWARTARMSASTQTSGIPGSGTGSAGSAADKTARTAGGGAASRLVQGTGRSTVLSVAGTTTVFAGTCLRADGSRMRARRQAAVHCARPHRASPRAVHGHLRGSSASSSNRTPAVPRRVSNPSARTHARTQCWSIAPSAGCLLSSKVIVPGRRAGCAPVAATAPGALL